MLGASLSPNSPSLVLDRSGSNGCCWPSVETLEARANPERAEVRLGDGRAATQRTRYEIIELRGRGSSQIRGGLELQVAELQGVAERIRRDIRSMEYAVCELLRRE